MFEKIKIKLVNYFIEREISRTTREKTPTNISEARTVGILFSLDNEQYYEKVNRLIEALTLKKKIVNALVFLPTKQIPNYFIARIKIDVFTSKNLNFFGIPKGGFIDEFINKKWDILLDLTLTDHLALDYIAAVSQAGFKVGRYREKMVKHFEVLISKNDEMDEAEYLNYFIDYLTKINTTKI